MTFLALLTDLLFKRFSEELRVASNDIPIKIKKQIFDDLMFEGKDPEGYMLYRYTTARQIYWERITNDFIKLLSHVLFDVGGLNQKALNLMMPG